VSITIFIVVIAVYVLYFVLNPVFPEDDLSLQYTENYEYLTKIWGVSLFACNKKIGHFEGVINICNEDVRRFAGVFQNLEPGNTVVQLWSSYTLYTTNFNIE
jgi:hypothetical protein